MDPYSIGAPACTEPALSNKVPTNTSELDASHVISLSVPAVN